jgi:hypothetical protein
MGRTPLRNSHPFAAQRQHLWPNASSLRAKHDGVVRAKREAWQRRRPLVGLASAVRNSSGSSTRLNSMRKNAPAEMVLICRVLLLP